MIVVGIAGRKRHGKDTLADFTIKHLEAAGFKVAKRHFADPLKLECATMMASELNTEYRDQARALFVREMNDDSTKEKYRLLLQWWGTEFKRRMVCDSYWIDKMRAQLKDDTAAGIDVVFIPDMRFPNEAALVKEVGGYAIRVERPGADEGDGHASEHALDDYQGWDWKFLNDASLPHLEAKACLLASGLLAIKQ